MMPAKATIPLSKRATLPWPGPRSHQTLDGVDGHDPHGRYLIVHCPRSQVGADGRSHRPREDDGRDDRACSRTMPMASAGTDDAIGSDLYGKPADLEYKYETEGDCDEISGSTVTEMRNQLCSVNSAQEKRRWTTASPVDQTASSSMANKSPKIPARKPPWLPLPASPVRPTDGCRTRRWPSTLSAACVARARGHPSPFFGGCERCSRRAWAKHVV